MIKVNPKITAKQSSNLGLSSLSSKLPKDKPKETEPSKFIALMGEAVTGNYTSYSTNKVLSTHGVESCTAVALWCDETKKGALLHIDHNIEKLIRPAMESAVGYVSEGLKKVKIEAHLAGGVWFSIVPQTYAPIAKILKEKQIDFKHNHWLWSDCSCRSYSVTLDLQTGQFNAFKTTSHILSRSMEQIPDERRRRYADRVTNLAPQQYGDSILLEGLEVITVEELEPYKINFVSF